MALRMIEIYLKETEDDKAHSLEELDGVIGVWQMSDEKGWVVKALLEAEKTEAFTDSCATKLGESTEYRIVLLAVEGTLPRDEDESEEEKESKKETKKIHRVSRDELYHEVVEGVEPSIVFFVMVALSALVASIGMMRDNIAVIIGAMVIAPLLGPNVGLSLSTTLGDKDLFRKSIITNITGVILVFVIAVALGYFVGVDPETQAILERSKISLSDIALAICAGIAGVLSYTSGVPAALIGVMVAVALLPPLAAMGLLLGSQHYQMALTSGLLVLTNLICINLAGTGTFLTLGVRPRKWWEAKKARKATIRALIAWFFLLAVLIFTIIYYNRLVD